MMSQTTEAFLKIATTFLSPLAAMRLLIAAICWVLAWRYAQPILASWDVPEAQLQIIVLAIGVSVGSILGYAAQAVVRWLQASSNRKKELVIAAAKLANQAEEQRRAAASLLSGFKETFPHFNYGQRSTLRLLTKRNQTLDMNDDGTKALISNKYISQIRRVSGTKHICSLHADLIGWVIEDYEREIENNISNFLDGPGRRLSLLAAISEPPGLLPIWEDELLDIHSYTQPIRRARQDSEENGFWLMVADDYLEPLERRVGRSLSEEVHIDETKIRRGNRPDIVGKAMRDSPV